MIETCLSFRCICSRSKDSNWGSPQSVTWKCQSTKSCTCHCTHQLCQYVEQTSDKGYFLSCQCCDCDSWIKVATTEMSKCINRDENQSHVIQNYHNVNCCSRIRIRKCCYCGSNSYIKKVIRSISSFKKGQAI